MNNQKCKETITHLERLSKQIYMLQSSLVEKDSVLAGRLRYMIFKARIQVEDAEYAIREHLNPGY